MYVKKFTGNTLDETLKTIKRELGPDAIIVKTETHKGLKGTFKKNKIEITAAISEREYVKKAKVDRVLDGDLKDRFYQNPANVVADSINKYNQVDEKVDRHNANGAYGQLGLNKKANMASMDNSDVPSLDEFLSGMRGKNIILQQSEAPEVHNFFEMNDKSEANIKTKSPVKVANPSSINEGSIKAEKILDLEKKIDELTKRINLLQDKRPLALYRLKSYLETLDLDELFIQGLIKKAMFSLSEEDLDNYETLYEFSLKEVAQSVYTEAPFYSTIQMAGKPCLTILISDTNVGQSSSAKKMAVLNENTDLVIYQDQIGRNHDDFAEKMLNIKIHKVEKYNEIFYEVKKILQENKSVIVDFKLSKNENSKENMKKFIEEISSSFDNTEILLCLSALNSTKYNKKIIENFSGKIDGLIFTNLDQTLSFSDLFNTHYQFPNIPLKFFSIGPVIPDDLEAATKERVISGIFKL